MVGNAKRVYHFSGSVCNPGSCQIFLGLRERERGSGRARGVSKGGTDVDAKQ